MNTIISYAISIAKNERLNNALDKADFAIYVIATSAWSYAKALAKAVFIALRWIAYKDSPRISEDTNLYLRAIGWALVLLAISYPLILIYNQEITDWINSLTA